MLLAGRYSSSTRYRTPICHYNYSLLWFRSLKSILALLCFRSTTLSCLSASAFPLNRPNPPQNLESVSRSNPEFQPRLRPRAFGLIPCQGISIPNFVKSAMKTDCRLCTFFLLAILLLISLTA